MAPEVAKITGLIIVTRLECQGMVKCYQAMVSINVERDQHGVWRYIFIGARPLTQHRVLRTAWEDSTLLDTQTLILMSNVIICLERFKRFNLRCMLLFL